MSSATFTHSSSPCALQLIWTGISTRAWLHRLAASRSAPAVCIQMLSIVRPAHEQRCHLGMPALRRRFCAPGTWQFAANGIRFTGASAVPVTRYRYAAALYRPQGTPAGPSTRLAPAGKTRGAPGAMRTARRVRRAGRETHQEQSWQGGPVRPNSPGRGRGEGGRRALRLLGGGRPAPAGETRRDHARALAPGPRPAQQGRRAAGLLTTPGPVPEHGQALRPGRRARTAAARPEVPARAGRPLPRLPAQTAGGGARGARAAAPAGIRERGYPGCSACSSATSTRDAPAPGTAHRTAHGDADPAHEPGEPSR
jgi:hypothetical protein